MRTNNYHIYINYKVTEVGKKTYGYLVAFKDGKSSCEFNFGEKHDSNPEMDSTVQQYI